MMGAADAPEMLDAKVQAFMLQLDAIVDYQEDNSQVVSMVTGIGAVIHN